MTDAELLAHATCFDFTGPDPQPFMPITVELTYGQAARDAGVPEPVTPMPAAEVWAVRCAQRCWHLLEGWVFEPQPSSRSDEFLLNTRFSRADALMLGRKLSSERNFPC